MFRKILVPTRLSPPGRQIIAQRFIVMDNRTSAASPITDERKTFLHASLQSLPFPWFGSQPANTFLMRKHVQWLILLIVLASPLTGWGCEPILPLGTLLMGSTLVGPGVLTQSLFWLAAAVAIKCAALVLLERRLPWANAVWFMLLANVLSTITGVLVATSAGSVAGSMLALPVVFALGWVAQRRLPLLLKPGQRPWVAGGKAMLAFVAFFYVSVLMYMLAQGALERRSFGDYWLCKFLFVTMVACTGILISTVLEECAIARLSRKSLGKISFYPSVLRANYVTLAVVLFVAAMEMLPKRLNAPHFIVSWLQSLSVALGFS